MTLNELSEKAHANSKEKGFYDEEIELLEANIDEVPRSTLHRMMTAKRLALIHGEVSEALEADRKGKVGSGVPCDINGN